MENQRPREVSVLGSRETVAVLVEEPAVEQLDLALKIKMMKLETQ